MRFKGALSGVLGLLAVLSLGFGCGSGTEKTPATSQQEMAASASSDAGKTAALVTQSVFQAVNLGGSQGATGLKLQEAAGGEVCPNPIDQTITVNDGSLQIQGSCASESTASGCVYRFDGLLRFHSFLLEPKKVLNGGLNAVLTVTSPACSPTDEGATVLLEATPLTLDPLTVNGVVYEILQASLSLQAVVSDLAARLRSDDFVCLANEESSSCFDDNDRDVVDDVHDNCVSASNPSQSDTDGDGIGDVCDNCPITSNADQTDADGDGQGDVCARICAPGVDLCETPADCGPGLGCVHGCCQPCPKTQFISLTCNDARAFNDSTGVTAEDSCDPFGHVCNEDDGCCEFQEFGEPFDLCGDTCGAGPEGAFDNCSVLFQASVCITPRCPSIKDIFGIDFGIGIDCATHGQLACDQLIGSGGFGFDLTCQAGCCVNGTSP